MKIFYQAKNMKLIIYLGHPAHFHLFKNVIKRLTENGHDVQIAIKSKDVLEELLEKSQLPYHNLNPLGRKDDRYSIITSLIKRDIKLLTICLKFKPQFLIGSAVEIAHVGKLLGIPSLVLFEDDLQEVPQFAKLAAPFSRHLVCPESCSPLKWQHKTIQYNSYHELAYLAPNYFVADKKNISELFNESEKIFILRFAKLTAYHDEGKTGITDQIAAQLISLLKPHGKIYITSERELTPQFEPYRININPLLMHDVLAHADMYIGDSQTMTAEAAVLGTPAIRFNDFVGRLGYLEELEHRYGLTYGIKTSEPARLFEKTKEILEYPKLKKEWQSRREKMLSEKIDLTALLVWLMEEYPKSARLLKDDQSVQYQFALNK